MLTDERNFRSTYYEKVGCRSVEEKKSLEILLKDKPLNRIKLKQFCLSFAVPAVYRSLLWNILLGVTSVYGESHEYVMAQRQTVYNDLHRALKCLRLVDENTSQSKIFYAMWLMENKKLKSGFNINSEDLFISIISVLWQITDDEVELYWISKGFYSLSLEIKNDFPKLKDLTLELMRKEDMLLYKHLEEHKILNELPLENWYSSCFADVLCKPALLRIWDKICGGSRKIVVFVFLVLVNKLERRIYQHKDVNKVLELIHGLKDNQETADQIVNKSIEMWQQNKGHTEFMIHRKDN